MGYSILFDHEGFHWSIFQSAYGAAGGTTSTLDEALVEMSIAESSIVERPYPPDVTAAMRANPEYHSRNMPRPGHPDWRPMKPYNGPIEVRILDE